MADQTIADQQAKRSDLRQSLTRIIGDSLYRNSSFLMLNSILVSAMGLLFWTLAARYFDADAIGTTTTVIAAATYAGMIGTLGLPNTVIRFLSGHREPVRLLTTAIAIATTAGAVVGLAWAIAPGGLGIPLSSVAPGWVMVPLITAVVAMGAIGAVLQSSIIALRRSKWVVVENSAGSLTKLVAMPLAVGTGAAGLFGLFAASLAVSTIASVIIVMRIMDAPMGRWRDRFDLATIAHVRSFAAGNHLAALVSTLPGPVVRIVVLSRLGAQTTAYLAMPLMIVALLKVIPSTASQSLFAEAAADERALGRHVRRTLLGVYAVMVPAIVVLVVLANPILSVFGTDYAEEGATCLRLLALSGVFSGFNYVADTVLNAQRHVRAYVTVNVVGSICTIAFPIAFVDHGLTGIGLGWLLGQGAYAGVAAFALYRNNAARSSEPRREMP